MIITVPFNVPGSKKEKYYRIEIKQSIIPNAGLGAYSKDYIPLGSYCEYKGVFVKSYDEDDSINEKNKLNVLYAWTVYTWKGDTILDDIYGYIDGYDINKSNWCRYVNCGVLDISNNLQVLQKEDKIFYQTLRDIIPGEEFYIDYGDEYRKYMKLDYSIYKR